jgi:hypothetical protein
MSKHHACSMGCFHSKYYEVMKKQESGLPDMRLKECELFELAHVLRVRPVLKEKQKGILLY